MHFFCCGYRLGRLGLQVSARWKWNREIFPIMFEKVTFTGTSWGLWENGKAVSRSFGVRRCSIHSATATAISVLRNWEGIGNTSINTYLARFPIQIPHMRITQSGVTEYHNHGNVPPRWTLLQESEGFWILRTTTPITLSKDVVSVHYSGGWSELRMKLIGSGWECKGICLTSHPMMEHGTTFIEYITQEAFVKTENEFNWVHHPVIFNMFEIIRNKFNDP